MSRRERLAGVAIGSATTAAAMSGAYTMAAIYPAVPAGCVTANVSGDGTYYLCGNVWLLPFYGANGVFYRVVPAP